MNFSFLANAYNNMGGGQNLGNKILRQVQAKYPFPFNMQFQAQAPTPPPAPVYNPFAEAAQAGSVNFPKFQPMRRQQLRSKAPTLTDRLGSF